jgi:hypothetical protein
LLESQTSILKECRQLVTVVVFFKNGSEMKGNYFPIKGYEKFREKNFFLI